MILQSEIIDGAGMSLVDADVLIKKNHVTCVPLDIERVKYCGALISHVKVTHYPTENDI